MEKRVIWGILFMLFATLVVAFEQPTIVGLQGKVTDSGGVPVNNGNLRATVSTAPSCEQNIIYDYTFNSVVKVGLFSVLLGNDSNLNLTYNQDYYLCTYINGEIQKNLGGSNTTKFRGGHGIIGASNLTNGTFRTGNYTFADNLSLGGWLFVKNDEDYLSRVFRAPIKYKDMVDRTAPENITGDWAFSGVVNITNSNSLIGNLSVETITNDEWIFIGFYNLSTAADINIENLGPSNVYKVSYILNFPSAGGDRSITMRINNVTGTGQTSKSLSVSNTVSESSGTSLGIADVGTAATILYGTTYITRDYTNGFARVTHNTWSSSATGPKTFVSGSVSIGGGAQITDIDITSSQGSPGSGSMAVIYRHRFFN